MPSAQSSRTPTSGKQLRLSDAGWVIKLAALALVKLIRARIAFEQLTASDIAVRNRAAAGPFQQNTDQHEASDHLLADRIGFVISRLSRRLPWRSDCLIQAIAAQEWLALHGVVSEIRIGVERPDNGPFGAHAWLVTDERIITGGDISRYTLLLGESENPVDGRNPAGPAEVGSAQLNEAALEASEMFTIRR